MFKNKLAQEFKYNTEHNKVYMLPNNKTYKHYFIAYVDWLSEALKKHNAIFLGSTITMQNKNNSILLAKYI